MVPVEEQPAPASGVVVGVVREQPGAFGGARGSVESLGRWNRNRAMPIKLKAERYAETMVRVAFGKLVDELVQTNASSGILAISCWSETRTHDKRTYTITVWGFSWSASPDDTGYQRHGFVGMQSDQSENIRFADFEGVIDDFVQDRAWDKMAVYRVTLPSRGLDPEKWVGRPPPPAPEELYTGPRRDGLLSTDEISGEYSAPGCTSTVLEVTICNSMTVVPLGADAIETWSSGCVCFPPLFMGPCAEPGVRTRNPGTNAFLNPQKPDPRYWVTFSADGTASGGFKRRPDSQKRAFQKVDARDLAGKWCGCFCFPVPLYWPLWPICCTRRKALNEDQYDECGLCCALGLPIPICDTRSRRYVNGHPTNGFDGNGCCDGPNTHWHRDPGCAAAGYGVFFAKKLC